jgi:hypothetical protein
LRASFRSSVGVRENVRRISPLNRRRLPNPAANAICAIGSRVSSSNFLAKCTRLVSATSIGVRAEMLHE